jgi:hypothetical protein
MSSELLTALAPFLERFRTQVHTDPRLKSELVALGRALIAFAEPHPRGEATYADSPPAPTSPPSSSQQSWPTPLPRRIEDRDHSHHSEEQLGWMPQEPSIIAGRCRAKGAAAKLMWQRCSNAIDEQQFQSGILEVRAQAEKLPKCTLWMLDLSLTRSAIVWEDLAGGYDTAADSAELLQLVTDPASKVESEQVLLALNLAAEAQSLLFSAVIDTGNPRPDADQIQLYVTVRELATARNTYIHRYLRREDRVDPRTWADLRKRITAANEPLGDFKKRSGNAKKLINNLRFKLKKAADGSARFDEWPRVMELLDEALASGIAITDCELRDTFLPFLDQLPEDLMIPASVGPMLREWDRYLCSNPPASLSEALSTDAHQLAARIKNRSIVVVGGLLRETERTAILRAFELSSVEWITLPDQAVELPKLLERPEVALILYSVRWSPGDSFAEVQRQCGAVRKPVVRLPGNYSPNAIAQEIVKQFRPS